MFALRIVLVASMAFGLIWLLGGRLLKESLAHGGLCPVCNGEGGPCETCNGLGVIAPDFHKNQSLTAQSEDSSRDPKKDS